MPARSGSSADNWDSLPSAERHAANRLAVETRQLTKRYGDATALDRCDLQVRAGEVLGLLGPNGAGKSTLIRLLLGAIRPTSGQATIFGLDCTAQRDLVHHQVSYLPGDARLPKRMKGREVLQFFAGLRSQKDASLGTALAARLDLDLNRRVGAMSTGMRQKLAIAVTLAARTPLTILDEPTANLDPSVRSEVLQLVRETRQAGGTVIFSSHVLSEIEESCDRVIVLRRGQLVHEQSLESLRQCHRIMAWMESPVPHLPDNLPATRLDSADPRQVILDTEDGLAPLLGWLASQPLREVRVDRVGLAEIYERFHREATPANAKEPT